ncbi:hypothetical protein ACO0M4_40850 [Streptomyces sp. RGM 3693]|uniref:hypothetical protein n=1 Tax=Streptomyces sp. RGM 3693 TaxID=3413284 RepID=UPI003D28BD3B
MDTTQQHLLDSYRAAQRGEAVPPAPGEATVRTAREIQQWHRFQAVVTDPAERWWGRDGRLLRGAAALLARRTRPLHGHTATPTWSGPGQPPAERAGSHHVGSNRAATALAEPCNAGPSDT